MPKIVARPVLQAALVMLTGVLIGAVLSTSVVSAQTQRAFTVRAHKYAFLVNGAAKPEIRVTQGDLVRITFLSEDIPHSFTIVDHDGSQYRIMRRAEPGKPVTFEFLADKAGTFAFRCTLTIDPGCKDMEGWLVVAPAK